MSLTVLWGGGAGLSPPKCGGGMGLGSPPLLGVSPPMSPPAGGVSNAFPPANNAVMGGVWGVPRWVGGRGVGPPRLTPPLAHGAAVSAVSAFILHLFFCPPPNKECTSPGVPPQRPPPFSSTAPPTAVGGMGAVCVRGGAVGVPFLPPPPPPQSFGAAPPRSGALHPGGGGTALCCYGISAVSPWGPSAGWGGGGEGQQA